MKRTLFKLVSAVSLLLCTAAAGMWIRSYFVWESWNCRAVIDREQGVFRAASVQPLPGYVSINWARVQTSDRASFERSTAKVCEYNGPGLQGKPGPSPAIPSLWYQLTNFSFKRDEATSDSRNTAS